MRRKSQEVDPARTCPRPRRRLGHRDAVALRRAAGSAPAARCPRGGRAARPGDHAIASRAITGRVCRRLVADADRGAQRGAAASALASSDARGRRPAGGRAPTSAPTGAISVSPTAWSISSSSRPAVAAEAGDDEADRAAVHAASRSPARSGVDRLVTPVRWRARASPAGRPGRRARRPSRPKRSAAAPESSACSAAARRVGGQARRTPAARRASASVTSCRRGSRVRAGQVVDRLAHLERVAGGACRAPGPCR